MGILFGSIGVGLWVLWSVGWKIPSVALTHAAMQTQGFLMTAFPRFTGTWPVTKTEIGILLAASLSFLVSTLQHHWLVAEISFLKLLRPK